MGSRRGWIVGVLLVLAGCEGTDEERRATGRVGGTTSDTSATETTAHWCRGEPEDLVNPRLPPAQAGDRGYGYHKLAQDDYDGDGMEETAHVIAQLHKEESGQYSGELGTPWYVYVNEASGERTYVYSDFVWGGPGLQVDVTGREGDRRFVIQYEAAGAFGLYCAEYLGPGNVRSMKVVEFEVSRPFNSSD